MTQANPSRPPTRGPTGLTERALGGMLWTFSGTGLQALVQVLVLMALGRLLTPSDFGLMGAAAVIVALSQIVSQVGVGPAIVQRKELDRTHVEVAWTISGALGFVLGAVVWLTAPALARFYRIPEVEPVLRGIAWLFPIDGLNTVGESLLTRQLRFRLFVALDVGSYVLGYALFGVLLAWQGYGVWALVGANLAQVTLRTIAMYLATRHAVRPNLNLRASRDLLSFGFGHSLAQVGTVLSQQGDNLVVGRYLGKAALGVYGRAYSLMVMPATIFGRIVNRVLFPVMSQVQDEKHRLASGYERALAIVALLSLPVSTFLWVVAPEFIPVLLGPRWTAAVLPFRMFSISLLFRMSSKISDACTKAAGAVYSRALLQGAYAVLVVIGALIGQQWGVGGVAVAVSVAMAINWLTMAELGRRVTGLTWLQFFRAHLPATGFALLIGAVLVSAAAGAVGTMVGQIAKLAGCRVVGTTGGQEKCDWLVRELGFDAAVDYRAGGLRRALAADCPAGIDVYFDNTGGPVLDAALSLMNLRGRIVCCGNVSQYDVEKPAPGPMAVPGLVVTKRLRMEGFIVMDFYDRRAEAEARLAQWVADGQIKAVVDVVDGLEKAPEALIGLFEGRNRGKRAVRI